MEVDTRQSQLAGIPYDQLRYASPQFTNPWGTNAPVSGQVYAAQPATTLDTSGQLQQRQTLTLPPYQQGLPIATTTLTPTSTLPTATYANASNIQHRPQDLMSRSPYGQYPPTSSAGYTPVTSGYGMELPQSRTAGFTYPTDPARRPSHPFNGTTAAQRSSFGDAVDASRGIISLSHSDITPTPRNMYGADHSQRSTSPESYGFPSAHSAHSSISSASGYQHSNYGSSVGDYSLTDYSSASESVDMNHRTLPPPSALGTSAPPAPQSMMGQFSSKVSSSSQKKHKCKVCDKRFTRPSSLQTHMYSHTGEKPFACDVEGCGRHFSVVSNLRRHKKVHKSDTASVTTNEDD